MDVFKPLINAAKEFQDSNIEEYYSRLDQITGHQIDPKYNEVLNDVASYIFRFSPYLDGLRSAAKHEKWYFRVVNGVADTKSALARVLYHCENLKRFEDDIIGLSQEHPAIGKLSATNIIQGGNLTKLTYEYQAMVMAYRTCLDYMAWGLSGTFKQDQSSFRDFRKMLDLKRGSHIERLGFAPLADALKSAYDRHASGFTFVMGKGENNENSIRDQIAHYGFVRPAQLIMTNAGIVLQGEAEAFIAGEENPRLSTVVERRVSNLSAAINDILSTYLSGLQAYDKPKAVGAYSPESRRGHVKVENLGFIVSGPGQTVFNRG